MRIVRTFECSRGHTHDDFTDNQIPPELDFRDCGECIALMTEMGRADPNSCFAWWPRAHGVLSPTLTTFKFADTSAQKHRQ